MTVEEIVEALEKRYLDIEKVKNIYDTNQGNRDIESMVAMNLSLRTSVYDREKEKSESMTYLLIQLSSSKSMEARWAVAKNPHTPLDILEKLANDEVNLVRALVATNPITPTSVLNKFFNDEKIVRDGLSGNPNTSKKLLNVLADDKDKMVRLRIAENSACDIGILEKLSRDNNIDVQTAARLNMEKLNEKA